MMARLARWLRLLGYDAPLLKKPPVQIKPDQVFLTRRRGWKNRPRVVYVLHDQLEDQLIQTVKKLDLQYKPQNIFTRCLECNLEVVPVLPSDVEGLVPEYVLHTAFRFSRCPGCGKVFWPGTHVDRSEAFLGKVFKKARKSSL
jgi:hypothetical protein